jgi:hypothetical protein
MFQLRNLLWLDSFAALIAGVAVISLSGWLSQLHELPQSFLVWIGLMNIIYGSFSFSLAIRAKRSKSLIVMLVIANTVWAVFCVVAAVALVDTASFFGLAHLIVEGFFVGGLAALEWNQREQLSMAM